MAIVFSFIREPRLLVISRHYLTLYFLDGYSRHNSSRDVFKTKLFHSPIHCFDLSFFEILPLAMPSASNAVCACLKGTFDLSSSAVRYMLFAELISLSVFPWGLCIAVRLNVSSTSVKFNYSIWYLILPQTLRSIWQILGDIEKNYRHSTCRRHRLRHRLRLEICQGYLTQYVYLWRRLTLEWSKNLSYPITFDEIINQTKRNVLSRFMADTIVGHVRRWKTLQKANQVQQESRSNSNVYRAVLIASVTYRLHWTIILHDQMDEVIGISDSTRIEYGAASIGHMIIKRTAFPADHMYCYRGS